MLLSIILTAAPGEFMAYRKSEKVCPTTVTIRQKTFFFLVVYIVQCSTYTQKRSTQWLEVDEGIR